MTPFVSSEKSNDPSRAMAIPAGRPKYDCPSSNRKPVRKSSTRSGLPF